ncbi:MAG: SUMF1/EgtB/PvdO family nonheme iron enzyme [Rhodospirillales bacterium]
MNEFERSIRKAKARQHRIYLLTICSFALACVIVVGVLVAASGTSIRILPPEAEESGAVRVVEGYAVAIDNVVYGFSEIPTIVVRAKGFWERRRQIQIEERGGTIEVRLTEIPGRLIAITNPVKSNTRWTLNGNLLAIDHKFNRDLEPGAYALRVDNPYFDVEEVEFEIKRAEKKEISINLRPVKGRLKVLSRPIGATISINGEVVGRTPTTLQLDGGKHKVVVEIKDYLAVEDMISLTNESGFIERNYKLKPVSSTLTFSVEPGGGQLLLDGKTIDPSRNYSVSTNVNHRVTYLRDGYYPVTKTVNLKARETKRLSFRLKLELAEVEIHASPSADIIIDGKKVGKKAVTLSLTAVPHSIELRKAGYRTIKKTVRPSSRRKTVIRERLITELAARLAESPREYKNTAEIELKLFLPNSFVMGAPRHQKGQRANEFLRNIVLDRPFYASKYEITNGQFKEFREDHPGPPQKPVTDVSWSNAAALCNWLSEKEGIAPFYKINNARVITVNDHSDGYRLLTEAEWEWLARKSGKKKQTIFPWGNESVVPFMAGNIADESANGLTSFYVPNYNDGYAKVAPVGSFPAEVSGLFDLTGNVSEWVHDFYSLAPPNEKIVLVDPLGPSFGDTHVIKGSSWRSGTRTLLRAAYRDGLIDRRDDVGFRIGRYLYGAKVATEN